MSERKPNAILIRNPALNMALVRLKSGQGNAEDFKTFRAALAVLSADRDEKALKTLGPQGDVQRGQAQAIREIAETIDAADLWQGRPETPEGPPA